MPLAQRLENYVKDISLSLVRLLFKSLVISCKIIFTSISQYYLTNLPRAHFTLHYSLLYPKVRYKRVCYNESILKFFGKQAQEVTDTLTFLVEEGKGGG